MWPQSDELDVGAGLMADDGGHGGGQVTTVSAFEAAGPARRDRVAAACRRSVCLLVTRKSRRGSCVFGLFTTCDWNARLRVGAACRGD